MTTLHIDQLTVRRQGDRITVHIPMTMKKRGGRKEILLPEGLASEGSPARKPATQDALIIAIARTHRWKALLESGQIPSIGELARANAASRLLCGRSLQHRPRAAAVESG